MLEILGDNLPVKKESLELIAFMLYQFTILLDCELEMYFNEASTEVCKLQSTIFLYQFYMIYVGYSNSVLASIFYTFWAVYQLGTSL